MYMDGRGVPQNHTEAMRWLRLAADQGDVEAQSNLGNMYIKGIGVKRSIAEAMKWYRRAADQGLAVAQLRLGPGRTARLCHGAHVVQLVGCPAQSRRSDKSRYYRAHVDAQADRRGAKVGPRVEAEAGTNPLSFEPLVDSRPISVAHRAGLYSCSECNGQFTVTVGTVWSAARFHSPSAPGDAPHGRKQEGDQLATAPTHVGRHLQVGMVHNASHPRGHGACEARPSRRPRPHASRATRR
jgi:hypothetical protein